MIPYSRQSINEADIEAVIEVLKGDMLTQGPAIEAFESAFKDYVGAKYAVAVSSCTAGLHLASLVAGLGPGQSLVTSPITFVATANAAQYVGADSRFVDIDPETVNMSPDALAELLETDPSVRVVSPVHFGGLPCDMVNIKKSADASGAALIEDAAHALGARYVDGGRVGDCVYSLMTVFSFHPVKAIAAGEGGMITTNNEDVYRSLLRARSHGINKLDDAFVFEDAAFDNGKANPWYYEMVDLGYHYRITDIQCALALSQLNRLDQFIARRRELALVYDQAFKDFEHCRPAQSSRDLSAHHLYVLRIDFKGLGKSRAEVMRELRSKGIISQVHYVPVPNQPFYQEKYGRLETVEHSQAYYQEALSIPLYYDLSDSDQAYVIDVLRGMLA